MYDCKGRKIQRSIDFAYWVSLASKALNPIMQNLTIYLTPQYLQMFINSHKKFDYLRQVVNLVREFIRLKF